MNLRVLSPVWQRWHGFLLGLLLVPGMVLGIGSMATAQNAGLPNELSSAWQATGLPESALSLQVQEVGGEPLMTLNPSQPRNPASVMKVVTTWAGLQGLGPAYRWKTSFLTGANASTDAQGTLKGPLYIQGSGDPVFAVADLWQMLRELRLRGIKNLSEVVVDRSVFGKVDIDPHAFDSSGDRPYNASPDAMMVGLGAIRLYVYPDAANKTWVPVVDPPVPGVRVQGKPEWRNGTCQGAPSMSTNIQESQGKVVINVSGEATGSCGPFSVWRLALGQPDHFASVFRMLWRELGGTLAHDVSTGKVPANASAIVTHQSDSLGDVIRRINKLSNNVMARNLLLSVGASLGGNGATSSSASRAVLDLLQRQGIDTAGWSIENGSGLSRTGRLTARGLAGMLDQAWLSPLMPEFVSSMAVAGIDGTVRRRLRNSPARGRAHLKTGTLRNARALAGYVQGKAGRRYILVSLVNHDNAIAARKFEDALVEWLASH